MSLPESHPPRRFWHFDLLVAESHRAWAPEGGETLVLWPERVDHDACFEAAGFTDFVDTDEAWDDAFAAEIHAVVDALGGVDIARLVAGDRPCRPRLLPFLRPRP